MSFDWPLKKLGNICTKIGSGATPKGGKEAYLPSGAFSLIRSQNVYNDGFSPSGLAFINEAQAKKLDGVSVEAGDVLLNITGDSVARVCRAPAQYLPARVNQHVAIIRPDPKVLNTRYLHYFLASPSQQEYLLGLAGAGATRNALTKGMIEELTVPCPPLGYQNAVADYLGALDDRITLLRETNKTLESIAQAIFKSWFVDFDPVRAKVEGRQPEGMDEATAALFPDSFEKSNLGLVPKGWAIKSLAETYDINPPRRLSKGTESTYLEMANVPTQGFSVDAVIKRAFGSGTKFVNGDTLLARITPCLENGKTAFVDFLSEAEVGWGSTEFIVLRPKEPLPTFHAYLLCRTPEFRSYAIQSMSGTSGRQRVQNDVLGQFYISIPGDAVAEKFSESCEVIRQKITINHSQAVTLASLRDTLLPRLISGQPRLSAAEELTEGALS